MKLNVLACCLSLLGTAAFAQKNEWRDPNVNEINRAPMHTNYFAYEDENSALKGCKESSGNFMTLSSMDGQYLGPVPSIIPEYSGDLSKLARMISCVVSFV